MPDEDKVFTMQEAMQYLKIGSRSTFYKLLREGKIKHTNLNPQGTYAIRRFKKKDLDDFLERGGVSEFQGS